MKTKNAVLKTIAISGVLILFSGFHTNPTQAQSGATGTDGVNPKKYFAMVACKQPTKKYERWVTPEETVELGRCLPPEPWKITIDGVTKDVWPGQLQEFGTYYESGFGFYSPEGLEEIAIPYMTDMMWEMSLLVFDTSTKERVHFSHGSGRRQDYTGIGFLRFQRSAPKIDMPATWHSSVRFSHAGSSTTESFNADAIPEREDCSEYAFSATGLELCPGLSQSTVNSLIGEPSDCSQTPNDAGTMCTYEDANYGNTPAKVVATYRHSLLVRADYFLNKDSNSLQLPIIFETLLGSPREKKGDSRLWKVGSQVLAYDPQSSSSTVKVFVLDNEAWRELTKLEKNLAVKTPSGNSPAKDVSESTPESEAVEKLATGLKKGLGALLGKKKD